MKYRFRYLALIMVIMSMLIIQGCGVDTSTLAGNVSGVEVSEEQVPAEEDVAQDMSRVLYDQSDFLAKVPEWDGEEPYCEINGNVPEFSESEIWKSTQEALDDLDSLGRCGEANSCIGRDGMPDKPRGNISEIHPTGWHTDKYDFVEGGNLYNRCHLIAHKLSGDDAVARNLITGTSYMNRQGMLPFEDEIEEYVKSTGNHVMYRVTPCFKGEELVARGVHMQAISVEDRGEGLAFNVFCYNVEPGIEIDYQTGDNRQSGSGEWNRDGWQDEEASSEVRSYVLNTNTHKFHYPTCNSVGQIKEKNREDVEDTRENIMAKGYQPCGNCHP